MCLFKITVLHLTIQSKCLERYSKPDSIINEITGFSYTLKIITLRRVLPPQF